MKKVFIPAGESRSYETLVTEHLVVDGHPEKKCDTVHPRLMNKRNTFASKNKHDG